jgi:hypothetical protein
MVQATPVAIKVDRKIHGLLKYDQPYVDFVCDITHCIRLIEQKIPTRSLDML